MSAKKKKIEAVCMYLYTIALLAINSVRIFNNSIWGDEGFSIRLAKSGMDYLIDRTARDVHPPLYYIILKGFSSIFEPTAMVGKFASFFAIVLVCVLACTYFYKKYGAAVAMIIVGVVTFTGNCVPMIVEIRMYTWALFFVFANLVCINEILELSTAKRKNLCWLGLVIFSLLAAYTHYYALISVAIMDATFFVILFLEDKKTWKYSIGSILAMVIGYLPWLFILLEQFQRTSQDYWIPNVDVKGYILYLFGTDKWGKILLIISCISLVCFYCTKDGFSISTNKNGDIHEMLLKWKWQFTCKTKEHKLVLVCIMATFGTILTGVLVSLLFRPLYVDRYIFPSIGLMAVALAISFVKSFRHRGFVVLLLIIMLFSGIGQFTRIYKVEASYLTEETIQYMNENLQEGDEILTDNPMLGWTVLEYYLPTYDRYYIEQYDIENLENDRVWLMLEEDQEFLSKCEDRGYNIENCGTWGIDNVTFELYFMEEVVEKESNAQ